jgi:hypothetical protein
MELTLSMKVPKNEREWRATTGFDQARFLKLSVVFQEGYESKFGRSISERTADSLKEVRFKTYQDLLFFTLFGLKSGLTNDVLGFLFGLDYSNAQRNQVLGLEVLQEGLALSGHLPKREFASAEEFAAYFNGHKTLILDGTEQRIQRPSDTEEQKAFYSGKKKSHR